jgi:ATP-dependent Clp protease protease subunit
LQYEVVKMKEIQINGVLVTDDLIDIYDFFNMPASAPGQLRAALDEADGDSIHVEINSPGGYVNVGAEMYNMIRTYRGPVTIDVTGQACSAASVVAMAGHSRISPAASIMIHNVSVDGVSGDYHDMQSAADTLKALNLSVANAYTTKTGMDRDKVLKMMDKETTMDAYESIENGFVDELIPGSTTATTANVSGCFILPKDKVASGKKQLAALKAAKAQAQLNLIKILEV